MPPQEKFETSAHLNNSRDNNLNCQNSMDIQIPEANEIKEETKDLDFDELLPYVGEFGLYQKILFILMIPFTSFVAWVYFSQIFITLIPEKYWCWVPELKNLTSNERLSLAIPLDHEGYSRCNMYDVNYTLILLNESYVPNPLWPTKTCQHGWEFNYSDVPYATVATELGWVCQYDSLPTVAQSIFFIGAIFGGLIFGWIADQYGRIPALIGANMMGFLAGVATAFTNTFWQFALCRFFVGFAFDNCFTMMYILVLEYVGPKWRTFVANMSIAMFFTFASCILPWIAYFLLDWRMTCIATSVPLILAVATPWLIPESARWLVSQGQVDKAIDILGKFERINGTKVPDDVYKRFRETCARICKEEEADKTYSVLDLFKTPRLRNITILFIIIWMAISLVFDGHVRNVNNLGLNVFVTFTIAAATELPADTFLTLVLDRWGRRWLACCSLVISGVFSIWASIVSNHIYTATLAILGRFWINISYNIGLQYAAEVLPTVVRAQGVALIHIMGYVASILAPFVVYLDVVSSILPLLVLGTLGIICGLLTLFLPETLDKDLPQTLQDGEDFGKDQKMWDFPCIERKRKDEEIPPVTIFRSFSKCSTRNSMRASLRGETLRSNMIRRSSIKSKKFKSSIIEVEKL
ncbi:organic cation transporter protein-like [Apis mellifera]|uniref:Organic cation transporter protein-like n=1 Tax=Apis mellifera TaxID=7460 RepID=A0A7M7MVT9_APIME|nr:organic cation transporter protein-like [Apis mellifera]|eukprot:XP_026301780.1 organic cation transporter protein-like [Apis mellifera]